MRINVIGIPPGLDAGQTLPPPVAGTAPGYGYDPLTVGTMPGPVSGPSPLPYYRTLGPVGASPSPYITSGTSPAYYRAPVTGTSPAPRTPFISSGTSPAYYRPSFMNMMRGMGMRMYRR